MLTYVLALRSPTAFRQHSHSYTQRCTTFNTYAMQILGIVGSPGKGKHTGFERVRRGMSEVCDTLQAKVLVPTTHLDALEERLHRPQVQSSHVVPCIQTSHPAHVCTVKSSVLGCIFKAQLRKTTTYRRLSS